MSNDIFEKMTEEERTLAWMCLIFNKDMFKVKAECTDAEIAKSFIEDVEAVKDQLPCGEQMDFEERKKVR